MNYYPFHIGDYLANAAHLSPIEDIAYRRLLDLYYSSEKRLPVDPVVCARKIRMLEYQAEVQQVLDEFFELTEEGWFSKRCEAEIDRMLQKQSKARSSAEASVAARKARSEQKSNERSANVERTLSERSTNVERTLNERSANAQRTLNENSANVELPTPTPTPTPIVVGGASKTRSARQCPKNFELTDEMREWAESNAPLVNIDKATATFRDHTFKNSISDWTGAWRNWLRRDQQHLADRQKPPSRAPPAENFADVSYGPGGLL